jgi:hypothetical protein
MSFKQRSLRASSVCILTMLAACGGGGGAGPVTTANNNTGGTSTGTTGTTGNTSTGGTSGSTSSGNTSSSGTTGTTGTTGTGTTGTGTTGTGTTGTGTTGTGTSGTGTTGTGSSGVTANVSIAAAGAPSLGGASFVAEAGATPNFNASLPPVGTSFPLMLTGRQVTLNAITDANVTSGSLVFTGTNTGGTATFELKIPGIGLDAPNLTGNTITLPDGHSAGFSMSPIATLNYVKLGTWRYFESSGVNGYEGAMLTGYQTQAGHVPTSGSASYLGVGSPNPSSKTGGVTGQVWVPSGGGNPIQGGGVSGSASLNVNFATGAVDGQLSNMQVGGNAVGSLPWNTINLTGTMSGSGMSGTTSTSGPPVSAPGYFPQGFSSAATGTFKGALFGPNADEVGAVWTLSESTPEGGKSALGVIGATRQ